MMDRFYLLVFGPFLLSLTGYSGNYVAGYTTQLYTHYHTGTPSNDGQVRLVNGNSYYNGRVEVYHNGQWGTICDDNFDHNDVMVICRQLGFYQGSSYGRAYGNAQFDQGSGPIWLHLLECNGYESSISQCSHQPWGSHNCRHSEDAGVDCYAYMNSMTTMDYYTTERPWWKTTNYTPWWTTAAYTNTLPAMNYTTTGRPWWTTLTSWWNTTAAPSYQCGGYFNETSAHFESPNFPFQYGNNQDCRYYISVPIGSRICLEVSNLATEACCDYLDIWDGASTTETSDNKRIIRLAGNNNTYVCSTRNSLSAHFHTDVSLTDRGFEANYTVFGPNFGQVRLVNGPNYYSGRVEVYYNWQWGTICDDNFDHNDVMVICRQLGFYHGSSYGQAYGNARFGGGSGQIWLDELACNGYESSITQCSHQVWGGHKCGHSEDAGLDCYAYMNDMTTMANYTTGRPWWQTTYSPWWQTTAGYTVQDAFRVGCSETGWDIQVDMSMLRRVYPSARASDIYLGENTCMGVESWNHVVFQQGLRECLTSEMVRHDVLVYSNQLVYAERDPVHSFIIRHYNWTVGVECDVQRNESSSGHIEHENHNNHGGPLVSGASHYTVNMTFYLDPNFQQPVPSNPLRVPVGTDVYVKVFTQATDWTVKMRVHTCYTKPSSTSPDHLRYNLIQNGCEVDTNTHLISQSTHETRFVFQDFEYTSNHQGIHVMCDAMFCSTSDYSRQCTQTCNPIIRRNVHVKPADDVTTSAFDVSAEGVKGSDSKTADIKAADIEQKTPHGNHA